jgi:cell wall-associated NlpC family hydrolase
MFSIVAAMKKPSAVFAALMVAATFSSLEASEPADVAAVVPAATAANHTGYLARTGELVIRALSLIGVKYKFGGKSPAEGLDCSGLVNHIFREVAGLLLPHNSKDISKVGSKIDKTKLEPGDLVFFNTRKEPFSHVGIYIGEQRFVHAPSSGRKVEVADMHDRYWHTRYDGARRVNF